MIELAKYGREGLPFLFWKEAQCLGLSLLLRHGHVSDGNGPPRLLGCLPALQPLSLINHSCSLSPVEGGVCKFRIWGWEVKGAPRAHRVRGERWKDRGEETIYRSYVLTGLGANGKVYANYILLSRSDEQDITCSELASV